MTMEFQPNRRTLLTSLSTIAISGLAGCTILSWGENESDSDGDGVPDQKDPFPNDSTRSKLAQRESLTLQIGRGEYQYLKFDRDQPTTLIYEVSVRDNTRIDVFITHGPEFQRFKDGRAWTYYQDDSELNTTHARNEIRLGPNEYYLILDNSDRGQATPPTTPSSEEVKMDIQYKLCI